MSEPVNTASIGDNKAQYLFTISDDSGATGEVYMVSNRELGEPVLADITD